MVTYTMKSTHRHNKIHGKSTKPLMYANVLLSMYACNIAVVAVGSNSDPSLPHLAQSPGIG